MGSIGIFGRRYYKDSYIFRLGRTEDIPEGFLLVFTSGFQQRAAGNRPYYAINSAWSRYSTWGYLYASISLGGFYFKQQWQEAGIVEQLLYFTPLMKLGRWRYRHYLGIRTTQLHHPLPLSYLTINQEQGLRGFSAPLLRGTSRLVLNYEVNLLPPLKLIGFRAALILFTDLAWIANSKKLLDKSNFYPGYGIGLRFRNDHLIFSTVQLMLGYYPNSSSLGMQQYRIYERSKLYYNYYNFQYTRPSTLNLF
jgi:hypothetical protein